MSLAALPAIAETLKIATYNAELSRRGPGLLLRDIQSGRDVQVQAAVTVIAAASPDILLLTGIDYDHGLVALGAFAGELEKAGASYQYLFARRPNTGMASGLDLDGDGRLGGPGDAQGYGAFAGEGGMAILSRLPIREGDAHDYSAFLWSDLPDNLIKGAVPSEAEPIQRLSSTAHWAVPVEVPGKGLLTLLAWYGAPPVFDGPEDRNGRRNHDETAFWLHLIDGRLPWPAPPAPFVILGDANLDPVDGEGRADSLEALLRDPRLQDPMPRSDGGAAAAGRDSRNRDHGGDPGLDTVDWSAKGGPGNMRVDYVLPSAAITVTDAGVWWPAMGPDASTAETASRHRLVWVEIDLP